MNPTKMEDCEGQQRCDNGCHRERGPEKAKEVLVEAKSWRDLIIPQTDWKLAGSIEIREP
jgi:hypothetical protein